MLLHGSSFETGDSFSACCVATPYILTLESSIVSTTLFEKCSRHKLPEVVTGVCCLREWTRRLRIWLCVDHRDLNEDERIAFPA